MPKITPKMEILVDISQPIEEIQQCIMHIVNCHPGKQEELLEQLDVWLGESLANMDKKTEEDK